MTPVRIALYSTLYGLRLSLEDHISLHPEADVGASEQVTRPYLIKMIKTAMHYISEWPVDKTGRWCGYIQGVMTVRGLLDVTEERDRTRPLFHEAYRQEGIAVPATREL